MTNTLLPHQLRVINERFELDARLNALHAFIDAREKFLDLPQGEQDRLIKQRDTMGTYRDILNERIAEFPDVMLDPIDAAIIENKDLRQQLDALLQRLYGNDGGTGRASQERTWVAHYITNAVMWLGMDMKALDASKPGAAPNPYPESKDPSTGATVAPTADGLKL